MQKPYSKLILLLAILLGVSFGLASCINHLSIFILYFFLPLIWLAFPNRWFATLFILSVYLSFSWEIVPDVLQYVKGSWLTLWLAMGAWGASALFPSFPWLICFPRNTPRYFEHSLFPLLAGLFFLLLLLTLPPFGVLIWGNPLMCAGLIYPGMSWFGLLCCFLLMCSVATILYVPFYRRAALIISAILLSIAAVAQFYFFPIQQAPDTWVALNTDSRFVASDHYLITLIKTQLYAGKKVIILPENTINLDNLINNAEWLPLIQLLQTTHATLISGAYHIASPSLTVYQGFEKKHREGVLILDQNHIAFHDTRQPLPIMSWLPFGTGDVAAFWWQTGVYEVQDKRVGIFMCFEDFLPWMMLMTLQGHPDILISLANHWWDMPTAIHKQLLIFQSWGRLLNTPVLMAENR